MAEKVDFHAPGVEVKKSACYFCHQNCGVLAYVKDGKCIGIEGDPDHITSQGGLCCRGTTGFDFLDHPARVNHALKRAGAKGENKWVEIPYDQAIEEIAAKLNQIKAESGAEAVATAGGTLRTDDWARRRFMNQFGSPNGFHNALLCWIPTFMIETAVSGWSPFETDLGNSKCLILWGINPGASNMPGMRGYTDLKKKGLKIICVDPRYSETAAHADIWLPLRPGSDTALSLAMLNTIIYEGLYDKKFVKEWCIGFDELKKHVKPYTARWASEKTWLDPELIREAARMYANNTPGNIQWGCTWDQVGKSAGAGAHARAIMRAICGNLDCPGGDLMPGPAANYITDEEMEANDWLPEEQKAKQIGSNKFKLTSWPGYQMIADTAKATWGKAPTAEWMCEAHGPSIFKAIITGDPYQIRALIVNATNPISCYGDSKMIFEAYKRIEFMVTVDYWITPTAAYSDYVLPAAGALERPVMHNNYGVTDSLVCSQRAIQPLYDRHTDYTFWRKLGLACGQDPEMWPWETEEEAFYYIISPTGYECDSYDDFVEKYRYYYPPQEFNKYTKNGFCTRSGKVELKSSILERLGYPPLPTYIAPSENEEENPDVASQFPLVLTTGGGFMPFHHSEHFNNMKMRYIKNDPYFTINPEKAAELGIEEGDWCWIETRRGRIKQRANVEPAIDPRVIVAQRGWWRPERGPQGIDPFGCLESNVNVLTSVDDWDCDPIGGSWANRGLLCRVYKVKPGDQIDISWSIPGSADTPGVSMMPSDQPLAYELVPYVEPEPDFEVPEGLVWDPDTETAWDEAHVLAYDPESGWLYHPETGTYYDLVTRFMYDGEQGCLVDGDGYRYDLETREPLDDMSAANALADLVYDEEGGYYWTPDYSCYYDQESGWLINAETGVYYDPTTRFAYDPETEDLVDEAGNHYPLGYIPEAEAAEEVAMDVPAGLVYDAESGYYWTEDYTCYYDRESGWLINYETGVYYCPTTRFAYDPEAGDLMDEATGQHYPLDYSPEAEAEVAPEPEPVVEAAPAVAVDASADPLAAVKAAIAAATPAVVEENFVRAGKLGALAPKPERLEYDSITGRMLDPETGKYYDKATCTEVELSRGQINRLEAGAKEIAKKAKKANKKAPFKVPEGLIWDEATGSAWDDTHTLEYVKLIGRLTDGQGNYFAVDTREPVELSRGQINMLEAEAKQIAKKAKKLNKKAPFKVPEGLIWDEATGSAWDDTHTLEYVKMIGRLVDAAGNYYAVDTREPVELSRGQINLLEAETKKMARAAKKANKKAPFEVPEGLMWDAETETAWDYDHVLAYDPESGWLYNPETQVFYDVFTRYAYDAEAGYLVDE
ncbi:MAG: OCRE domain-containing protein, partial [Coriobacteriales bacterium]